jgi:hypothetical protein
VKVRAKSVYMEDVESRLARISGVSAGHCVALAGRGANGDRLVALVEAQVGPWIERVAAVLEHAAGGELEIAVLQAERGTISRTSSGKPRRRVMWQALVEGQLPATEVLRRAARVGGSETQAVDIATMPGLDQDEAPVDAKDTPPVDPSKATPVDAKDTPPVDPSKATPVDAKDTPPVDPSKATPVDAKDTPPVGPSKAAPVDATEHPRPSSLAATAGGAR